MARSALSRDRDDSTNHPVDLAEQIELAGSIDAKANIRTAGT
jgi:hypothetical protein